MPSLAALTAAAAGLAMLPGAVTTAVGRPAATPLVAAAPAPGAAGIGDRLYPTLGNGGFDVLHYDLDLRFATASPSQGLTGTVTITARATQALSRFNLDYSGGRLGQITVNGRPATVARAGEELVVTPASALAQGATFTVVIRGVTATPTTPDPDRFLSTVFVKTPDGTAWSPQPNGAHAIFPSNDHPKDKATFTFRLDVPAGTTAVANGVLAERTAAAGRTRWRYEQRQPMATELAQVAVGRYTVTDRGRHGGVHVRDVTPTRLTKSLVPKLQVAVGQLAWMRAQVGPYPFDTYGSLVVDTELGFALETQTLSLYDTPWFVGPRGLWEPVMLHELAHQWFGDSVSPVRWSDVWQSEGHASWYEFQYAASKGYLAQDTGLSGVRTVPQLMKHLYLLGDAYRAQFGPVARPRSNDVDAVFNPNVYGGGALVLYALQRKIGVKAFAALQREWVTYYRGRSASTQTFIALASRVSGRDVGPFLRAWLYGTRTPPMPGHPDWRVAPAGSAAATAAAAALPLAAARVVHRRH